VRRGLAVVTDGELAEVLTIASRDDLASHDVLEHARFLVSSLLVGTV
jgi:hypothetical protein